MSKETTKKRSQSAKTKTKTSAKAKSSAKAKARKRQKTKLVITGILAALLIVVSVVAIFVLGGFGGKTASENSIYIYKNGKVLSTSIESFDENVYDKSELKSYIRETISAYNKEMGSTLVRQKSFNLKNGVVTSVLHYANADAFTDFFGTELFVGTIAEAMAAGFEFDIPFASVNGEVKEVTNEAFILDEGYKVAIVRANTKVTVEGTVCYVSTENIADVGNDYVVIAAVDVEDGYLANMQMIDSTEAEEVDGAVSDDDLLSEGMAYDFGEEDVPVRDYTDVYTYIIYKTGK